MILAVAARARSPHSGRSRRAAPGPAAPRDHQQRRQRDREHAKQAARAPTRCSCPDSRANASTSMTSALIAAITDQDALRCPACRASAMSNRLANSAPTIAPTVFAAYTRADEPCRVLVRVGRPPRARAGSSRPRECARAAPPRAQRTKSIWNVEPSASWRQRRVDRPVRKRRASASTRPTRAPTMSSELAHAERGARIRHVARDAASRRCCRCRARSGTPARMSENV